MTLEEVRRLLEADVIAGSDLSRMDVTIACGADLMSDVLAHIKVGALLLTGLTNPQVVRTAEMAGVKALCFVRGKRPSSETVRLAASNGIPLMATELPMFESCGRLYTAGLPGCTDGA